MIHLINDNTFYCIIVRLQRCLEHRFRITYNQEIRTPLQHSVARCYVDMVQVLLKFGAFVVSHTSYILTAPTHIELDTMVCFPIE
jgi:hypothetical protein